MPLHQLFMIFLLVSLCNSGTILVSSDNEQPKHVITVSKALEAKTFGLIRDLIFGPTKTTSTTTTETPAVIATSDDCRCGIKTGNRILGGLETEVRTGASTYWRWWLSHLRWMNILGWPSLPRQGDWNKKAVGQHWYLWSFPIPQNSIFWKYFFRLLTGGPSLLHTVSSQKVLMTSSLSSLSSVSAYTNKFCIFVYLYLCICVFVFVFWSYRVL